MCALILIGAMCLAFPANAVAQAKNSPLGFIFTPAHIPNVTSTDVVQAALEGAAIGGHGSFLWEWASGNVGYSQVQGVVPLYRMLGQKVFLQFSPTGIGQVTPPDGLAQSFADPTVRQRFLQDVSNLAALKPDYLNLGAEINLLYYLNRTEFNNYATLYQQAYQNIKQISPNTQVGVSYHLDLFFGDTEYNLLTDLGPQDFVAFTTYPAWTVYRGFYPAPDQMSTLYYDRIRLVIPTKPVIFSEVGWPTAGLGSVADQDKFVSSLPRYFAKVKPVLVTFAMQHDADHFRVEMLNQAQVLILQGFQVDPAELFAELNSMGLLSWDGPPKPAYITAGTLNFTQ